ncbi:molybdenum cofactor guanylyltransferase MobA [Ectopseudomonas mendocina]|uniref:Molybdenum cofactor guanylyltransferase n=1 Tax=Ectopseudomonas mendocina TaxID=300 RepID=A0ABZ2RHL1_ECTME
MPDQLTPFSILILAGGRGQRMGGQDKGLIHWQGRPMIEWVHGVVRPLTDDLIISCNRNAEPYSVYADRLFADDDATFEGPLAGIRAGLRNARHSQLLVLPCDAPRVDQTLIEEIISRCGQHPVIVKSGGWIEPLFCLIPTLLNNDLELQWRSGQRSPQRWLSSHAPVFIECPTDDPRLSNFNTPQSLLVVK